MAKEQRASRRGLCRRLLSFLSDNLLAGSSAPNPYVRGFMFITPTVVIVCGLIAGAQIVGRHRTLISDTWPATQAQITFSRYFSGSGESGDGDWGSVFYRFQTNGQNYSGYRVSFLHNDTTARDVARYPEGKVVTAHYDPDDPVNAVLETELSMRRRVLFWMPASMALLGLFGMSTVAGTSFVSWLRSQHWRAWLG